MGSEIGSLILCEFHEKQPWRSPTYSSRPFFMLINSLTFFLLAASLLPKSPVSISHALTPEGEALLVFKAGLHDAVGVLRNWRSSDEHPCHWRGVRCSRRMHVIGLNLPYSRLWGRISPDIGKLRRLKRLSLHDNNLYGPLPSEIRNCSRLKALYLQDNFLSGPVPQELGFFPHLIILDISGNTFSGTIPPSLGQLKNLKYLNMSTNLLVGRIPEAGILSRFSSASFCGNLDLCGNQVGTVCKTDLSSPPAINDTDRNSTTSPKVNAAADQKRSAIYVSSLLIGAMGTMGVSFAFVLVCFWGYLLYHKRVQSRDEILKPVVSSSATENRVKINLFHGDIPFSSRDIMRRIEMLDESNIVGSGGFGTVYKLDMDSSNVFAVKKVEKQGKQCERIFERELEILGMLRHRNLVNLRGYCSAYAVNLLIYDFLPNGSLESLLHDRTPEMPPLTWAQRVRIAIGAARGLSYLHHDCCPRIVHRDIKSSNILLDEHLEPHLADFGLAKLMEDSDNPPPTTVLAGTFGYLAPEYTQSGIATEKTDVYSYGVLLIELISGRRPTELSYAEMGMSLSGWMEMLIREDRLVGIIDPSCCEEIVRESLETMLCVAASCVSASSDKRPSMNKVVQILEADSMSPCPSDFYDSSSD